jgi:hypothetical protein
VEVVSITRGGGGLVFYIVFVPQYVTVLGFGLNVSLCIKNDNMQRNVITELV